MDYSFQAQLLSLFRNKFLQKIFFLIFILILTLFYHIGNIDNGLRLNYNNPHSKNLPDTESWNSAIRFTKDGKPNLTMSYGYMYEYKNTNIVMFEDGISIDAYNENGEHAFKLLADKGCFHKNKGKFIALGNVQVSTDSGMVLKTEYLTWNRSKNKVLSDHPVTVFMVNREVVFGKGFESDYFFNNLIIKD